MEDYNDRPWERPGCVRRDCEPHRGQLLHVLGTVALILGRLCLVFPPFSLFGLPLSVWVKVTAQKDRTKMNAGLMDPAGMGYVTKAARYSIDGAVFCVLLPILFCVGCLMAYRSLQ
jgi:hypothetical protein